MSTQPPSSAFPTSTAPPTNLPKPEDFHTDPRVHYDQSSAKWMYEDHESGAEFEWSDQGKAWIPVITEDLLKAQQAAYAVEGVDEEAPVAPKQHILNQRKRKQAEIDYTSNDPIPSAGTGQPPPPVSDLAIASGSKTFSKPPKAPRPVTDVYVTNLPLSTTAEVLAETFGRAGLLMTDDEGNPKVKLYTDAQGRLKGDALVSYFKPNSVDLACTLFDDTELVLGSGEGNIRVTKAEYKKPSKDAEKVKERQEEAQGQAPKDMGIGVGQQKGKAKKKAPKVLTEEQRRAAKRIRTLQSKLEDWSSGDEEDPAAPAGGAPPPGNSRFARVVVLKHMFTLKELEEDPSLALDLKEDVREEAETIGVVTNVTLYDEEEDGVITVKFKDAISAQACILKMNGRFFGGRQVSAAVYTGKERFKQSGQNDDFIDPEEVDAVEKQRLDKFAAWLVDGPGEDGQDTEP